MEIGVLKLSEKMGEMNMETGIFDGLDSVFNEFTDQLDMPNFIENDEISEFAPPMEIQAQEISEFFHETDGLQFSNWKELDVDERVEALSLLEKETAEIAHRPSLEVTYEVMEDGKFGYFDGCRIVLSEKFLSSDSYEDYKETLNTVFHEGRHGYQDYNLREQRVDQSMELVESWRVNEDILGYKNGENSLIRELGYYEYYTQPVEVDARFFAETVIGKLDI